METILMPSILTEKKMRERFFLYLLIALYIMLEVLRLVFPMLLVTSPEEVFNSTKLHIVSGVDILSSLFQMVVCLYMVMLAKRWGLIAVVGLSGIELGITLCNIIMYKRYLTIPIIVIDLLTVLVCFLTYYQMQLIHKNVKKLHYLAYTDMLTGVPNRNAQVELMNDYISGPNQIPVFSVILFDFDNFKMINDYLGHQIGDVFLMENAKKLKDAIGDKATISRVGDDRFSIIVPDMVSMRDLDDFTHHLQEVISEPFQYNDHDYHATASIGVACYPKDATTLNDLFRLAEIALYRAKAYGKSKIVFFQEKMQEKLERQMSLEHLLFNAIKNNELYLVYQPQYHYF